MMPPSPPPKRLVDCHDVELWQGARMVTNLAHKAD
jgi:hypothetical protein